MAQNTAKNVKLELSSEQKPYLPIKYFRPEIQSILMEYSKVLKIPINWVIGSAMAMVATALGHKITIFDGKYTNTPNIWVILVGKSGTNKTAPISFLRKPIDELNKLVIDTSKAEISQWKVNGRKGEMPTKHRIVIQGDTTSEGLKLELADNPKGVAVIQDEIDVWFDMFGKYNNSHREDSSLLNFRDNGPICVIRKDRENDIESPSSYLTVLGSTQKTTLPEIIKDRWLTNGFAARIYWIFDNYLGLETNKRKLDEPQVDPFKEAAWSSILKTLWNAPEARLTLTHEAMVKYIDYWNTIETAKAKYDSENEDEKFAMYAKLQKGISEFLCIVHYMCSDANGGVYSLPTTDSISATEVDCAIEIINFLEVQDMELLDFMGGEKLHSDQACIRHFWKLLCKRHMGKNKPMISQNQFAELLLMDKGNLSKLLSKIY